MGPFAGGVEDAEDFEGVGADSVGDDVGSVGDEELGGGDASICIRQFKLARS
jgi:hypothetical protein